MRIGGSNMTTARLVNVLGFLMVAAAILWALSVQRMLGFNFFGGQYLYFLMALATVVIFFTHPFLRSRPKLSRFIDVPLALIGAGAMITTIVMFPELIDQANFRDYGTLGLSLAAITILVLIEGMRRTAGPALTIIVIGALLIAIFAQYLPSPLTGRPFRPESFLYKMAYMDGNILGAPLSIVGAVVIAFIFMGSMLQATGGGEFFSDLAAALMGRSRGGSAKIAVTASGFFGAISGSAVSNVVSTGMVTIPLMKKAGYKAQVAGAIEAVASTGGQLVPPVMGAAAFLMAVTTQTDYSVIVVASLIPAFLYYLALFLQIDLMAGRDGIKGVEGKDLPSASEALRQGWVFILPFVVLIIGLFFLAWRPEYAALASTAAMFLALVVFGYRGARPGLAQIVQAFRDTAEASVGIIFIAAAAGIVIGALNDSGVLFAITGAILAIGDSSLPLLLILAAILCIILGMGMPTVGVYALLSTLVAAPLVELGVNLISAHLFVLYFGMMSMITPPVAVASFAAAAISRTGAMRTGWSAVQLGWAAYVIPFVFVVNPALIMDGSVIEIVFAVARATIGVWLVSACIIGYLNHPLSAPLRLSYLALGILLLVPGLVLPGGLWAGGGLTLAAGLAVLSYEFLIARRKELDLV
ncbi:C4-dicarboxylate ABC transporter permease [Mameliella alba]|nr:C4-dicarboxylate ABC transporter permease [Mameliella alba]